MNWVWPPLTSFYSKVQSNTHANKIAPRSAQGLLFPRECTAAVAGRQGSIPFIVSRYVLHARAKLTFATTFGSEVVVTYCASRVFW